MAREVKIGDTVKLKCCPQEMVVESVSGDGDLGNICACAWINDCGKPYREHYKSNVLNFVAEGAAEARFRGKPAPEEEPLTIKEEDIPF